MIHIKHTATIVMMLLLALFITGCANNLPKKVTAELEKISNAKIGFVTLIDGQSGLTKYLKNEDAAAGVTHGPQSASEIKRITSVSVVGIPEIKIKEDVYRFCNLINVDGHTRLICKSRDDQSSKSLATSPLKIIKITGELVHKLAETSGIDNIGFLVLTDIVSGETSILKHENYIDVPISLPLLPTEGILISSNKTWSIVTYKKNPTCQWIVTDGKSEYVCTR